ncbi:MAG: orotate phosphoribosyltransferase [Parcubacteria group bacterium]
MENAKQIASTLLEIKAVTLSTNPPYTWTSGIKSPIYCDNRLLMSYPDKRQQVKEMFLSLIKENNLEFDVIAGVATSGIPHAAWLAEELKKPMIYVRGKAKEHGKENAIEGVIEKGKKVLVIEDLISTGGSTLFVVEEIRQAGGIVEDCLAIFTYEFDKAKKAFAEAKANLHTLTNFSTLIEVATENDYLKAADKDTVLEWSKDPENWGK